MKELKIYFGDLTHDSVGLATEVFPLNVGLIAAYTKKVFGDAVQIRLFKYVSDLENALYDDPPDILALSNYPWCHNIDFAMFRLLKERRPEALRILGGPNFPHIHTLQEEFMQQRPLLDAYVYLDGEFGFANLIRFVFEAHSLAEARERLHVDPIEGLAQLNFQNTLLAPTKAIRPSTLDEIPSPYLTGLLDPFFDGRLSPMIQTNRGCPFTCTYCADGTSLVNKINHFSVERVRAELTYIGERIPKNIKALFISDLNFGMYRRDAEIADAIAAIRQECDYPHYIDTTTGKNSRARVIRNVEKLSGALALTMSVQSMTEEVLVNIKRDNMRLGDFLALKPAMQRAGLPATAEVILGLPGETRSSHLDSLDQLLTSEIDNVFSYTLMLLNGSELNTPEQREKWGYASKFRVIPRDFTKLRSNEKVIEVEEVVISSNTLSFEDYVFCRRFVLLLVVTNNIGFRPLLRFLLQNKIGVRTLLERMLARLADETPMMLKKYLDEFTRETHEELWDSEQEIIEFFQNEENYAGLLNGTYGANLIQTYKARIWAHAFEELADLAFAETRAIMAERGLNNQTLAMEDIEAFCRARTHNLLGPDRLNTNPHITLQWDIMGWMEDPDQKPLDAFRLEASRSCRFELSRQQYELLEAVYNQFGQSDLGKGKSLIRLSLNTLWRTPVELPPHAVPPPFYEVSIANRIRT